MLVYLMDSRGTSTKTRIETYVVTDHGTPASQIREAHPLKQGLKQVLTGSNDTVTAHSRGTSTKTRIETYFPFLMLHSQVLFERHIH